MNGTMITIVGNLAGDPDLRFTASGIAVARFTVGVNRRTRNDAGEWVDGSTSWYDVSAWRDLAEHCAESLVKGCRVVVVGEHEQRSWTDASTGEKRYGWQVNASAVGAELTFATAKLTRAAKGRQEVAPDDAWAAASRTRPAVPAE